MGDASRVFFSVRGSLLPAVIKHGLSILEGVHGTSIPLQGACEGSLACSTCHIVFDKEAYEKTKHSMSEKEEDLLDTAKGLTLTSRLGCQVKMNAGLRNAHIRIPNISKNIGDEVLKKHEGKRNKEKQE